MKKFLTILLILTFAIPSFADTFYIRQGGTAKSKASATGPCNITSACGDDRNINSWASVGDTVYICSDGGPIQTPITGSKACNTGRCSKSDLITYQKSPDSADIPDWSSNTPMIHIKGDISNYKEHMLFKDLQHTRFDAKGYPLKISYAKNITLDNVNIMVSPSSISYGGIAAVSYVQDIIVQNGSYSAEGQTADVESEGFGFYFEAAEILIYKNYFGNATHNSLRFYNTTPNGRIENIVIRGNIFENKWEHHYTLSPKDITEADNGRILIEENIFKNGGQRDDSNPCTQEGGGCEDNQTNYPHTGIHQVISRGNIYYSNDIDVGFYVPPNGPNTINDWKHYHNTHYKPEIPEKKSEGSTTSKAAKKLVDTEANFKTNGVTTGDFVLNMTDMNRTTVLSVDSETQLTLAVDNFSSGDHYIVSTTYEGGYSFLIYGKDQTLAGLSIINNIMWDYDGYENHRNVQIYHSSVKLLNDRVESNIMGGPEKSRISSHLYRTQEEQLTATVNANLSQWINNEDSNPIFANAAKRNLTIRDSSPAVDKGTYLTKTKNAATHRSSSKLVVHDATFFYGADWSVPGGAEAGDYIKVMGDGDPADFIVQVIGVDYTTDTLTLASNQNWDDGAYVYWCPLRNAVCFSGFAPDIGATELEISKEASGTKKISSPTNLKILSPKNSD